MPAPTGLTVDHAARLVAEAGTLHQRLVDGNEKLTRGRVWCIACGASQAVDPVACLRHGWPRCCGMTMTIDSPEERRG